MTRPAANLPARAHPLAVVAGRSVLHVPAVSFPRLLGRGLRWWTRRIGGEPFEARADDGASLAGLYVPARQTATPQPRLPVILAHGYCESKECHLREALLLREHGHDVVLIDLRGHGASSRACTTFGVRERRDVAAIIDFAQQRGWVADRVIDFGYSLGAGTMLQHAANDTRVAGVVALAPFFDMRRAVRSFRKVFAPWLGHRWLMRGMKQAAREAGFTMTTASAAQALATLRIPVLIAVGDRDVHLPAGEHALRLARLRNKESCRIVQVPGATHLSIYRRRWPQLDESLVAFCRDLSTV